MQLVSDRMMLLTALIGLACVAPGLTQRGGFRQAAGSRGLRMRMAMNGRVRSQPTRHKSPRKPAQTCYTPENDFGQCLPLSNCPAIVNIFNAYPQNVATNYVLAAKRSCGNNNNRGDPVVCCRAQQQQQQIRTTTVRNTNPFFPTNPATSPPIIIAPTPRPVAPTIATRVETTTTPRPPPSTTTGISEGVCRGPDLLYGTCTPLTQCAVLLQKLQANSQDPTFASFLRSSNEICANEYAVVCCPVADQTQFKQEPVFPANTNAVPRKLLTMEDGCGYADNAFRKIVGGKTSKIGAWPWIALIGYDDGVSASPFKCGGALITARHVVTAAHCIRTDLTFVRLGEHDLSTDTETRHVDVPVVKTLRHPQYNKQDGRNDIALLYLAQNVQFSSLITPICLPITPAQRSKSFVNHTPFVAGWGRTMEGGISATVLQELQIPVYDNSVCKDLYKKQNKLISEQQFDGAVICAGDLGGGKDTCQGDSGGPLMTPEAFGRGVRFHLIGVVSYGIGCARPETPGVYSRVANFIDWIQQGVADT